MAAIRCWAQRLELEPGVVVERGEPVAEEWNDLRLLRALAEARCCELGDLVGYMRGEDARA